MSSIGHNIPNANNEMRIESGGGPKDVKKSEKQQSTSGLALKALNQLKEGVSNINLAKHLGNLKQLSESLNKLSMSLFSKIFSKPKEKLPPLMTFEGMNQSSVQKSSLSEVFAKLAKSQKSSIPINLMDQDTKSNLGLLHEQVEQSNHELNKTLSQLAQQRHSLNPLGSLVDVPAGLPKIKVRSQGDEKAEKSPPPSPKFQINSKDSATPTPTLATLKEAASKLQLGGDFKAGLKTILQNTKKQIDDNQGEVKQIKKKLTDVKEILQSAHNSGVVDKSSAKELIDNLDFFDQVTEKNINALDEMKKSVDDWAIPVNYGKV